MNSHAQAEFALSLEHFQGPMDVLLHLIERNKIPIAQISISELCDQYIAFLLPHLNRDPEELSAFVLMAARLLELKARSMLPKKPREDEPDDEAELARRLEQYLRYKQIGRGLVGLLKGEHWYRGASPEFAHVSKEQPWPVPEILAQQSLAGLNAMYRELLLRQGFEAIAVTAPAAAIQADAFTIEDKIQHVIAYLKAYGRGNFSQLLPPSADRPERLATFLAVLELAKGDSLKISQSGLFSEIAIVLNIR